MGAHKKVSNSLKYIKTGDKMGIISEKTKAFIKIQLLNIQQVNINEIYK